ncbi:hypothetical protein [Methanobrevibacter sp.]|uniref:hypothetical protein n=1 Tax=Methanobrevibacter sp. TaxID=66852 RepID=UPI0038668142
MFVIGREGHMGFWWDGESTLFVEEGSGIFPSRSSCLEYLKKFHTKDEAIEIIMMIKKGNGKIYSF